MWFLLIFALCSPNTLGQKLPPHNNEPFFVEEPDNVTVIAGKKVLLKCVVGNTQGRPVQWTFDNFGLGLDRGLTDWPHLRMVGANPKNDWNLEIDPVSIRDDGKYQCQVTPHRSRDAYVNVWVAPEDPFIEDGPVMHVKESVEVKLECVARGGKPPAKINWYDQRGNLINDASYRSYKMRDSKLFEARSVMTFVPRREHHNATFRCEAWNEAANNLRPALARLFVQYAPSVTVTPVRPGMIQEGDKAAFHCNAVANPPVYDHSYKWFIGNREIPGAHGFYYEIFNVTRAYHDKQVRCSVENVLGVAMGLKTIEVKYGPTFLYHPHTTSGDRLESITLHCVVDSNPLPQYYWTKGASREPISRDQNMTVRIEDSTTGSYLCHASAPGYSVITSRAAEVLMTGRPQISSSQSQTGVEGENVHINCAAISIPKYKSITWTYHGSHLDDTNTHYRIIDSPIQHGVRSTLIIKQALATDFGPYTCAIENSHGVSEIRIQLEQRKPFPLQMVLIAILTGVSLVFGIAILVILFRRRTNCCYNDKDGSDKVSATSTDSSALANNVILKVNNMGQMSDMKQRVATPSQLSNEVDSSDNGGWDNEPDFHHSSGTTQLFSEPDFPPKPDVISTGYFPYAQYVRDYNPPSTPMMGGQESPMYSTIPNRQVSMLNVTDPRFSATYGNPLLRQTANTAPRGYTTFMPGPIAPPQVPQYNSQTFVTLPMSSQRTNNVPSSKGSTTPNSSISNMACLPEDRLSNNVSGSTPSPPPPVLDPPMSSTTAIYARVNPNMKRDKTSNAVNNNFTSTFAPLQQQAINSRSATESTGDFKIQGPVNPSITNGCVHQQRPPGSLQRPPNHQPPPLNNSAVQQQQNQLHSAISNSVAGTHV